MGIHGNYSYWYSYWSKITALNRIALFVKWIFPKFSQHHLVVK